MWRALLWLIFTFAVWITAIIVLSLTNFSLLVGTGSAIGAVVLWKFGLKRLSYLVLVPALITITALGMWMTEQAGPIHDLLENSWHWWGFLAMGPAFLVAMVGVFVGIAGFFGSLVSSAAVVAPK